MTELIRSLIFVPGNRANMLERARSFSADIIMVDLEDSVPPAEKANAKELATQWVPVLQGEGQRVMVRVNSLDTGLTRDELEAVVSSHLYGISLGKVESVWHIRDVDRLLTALEPAASVLPGSIKIIPWIESAKAVWAAREIAESSPRVIAIAFGAEDYTNDMGVERTDAGEEVSVPRAMVPVAARAGDVIFFHGHLIHRSRQNRSTDRLRRAYVCHYANARSYTEWGGGNINQLLARGSTHLPHATTKFIQT